MFDTKKLIEDAKIKREQIEEVAAAFSDEQAYDLSLIHI